MKFLKLPGLVLLLLVIIMLAAFGMQSGNVAKIEFKDGSYVQLRQPQQNWCFDNNTLYGWLKMKTSGVHSVKILDAGNCGLFVPQQTSAEFGQVFFSSHERSAAEASLCKGKPTEETDFESVGGKVFYCDAGSIKNSQEAVVAFIYPIDAHKSFSALMRKKFFIDNHKDLLPVLQLAQYKTK